MSDDALATGWQHGMDGGFGAAATMLQQQQQPLATLLQRPAAFQQPPAAAGTAAAAIQAADPWCSGLDLVAANSAAAADMHLTDAGLDALLAPFEDWAPGMPCLLQPEAGAPMDALQQPPTLDFAACSSQQLAACPPLLEGLGSASLGSAPLASAPLSSAPLGSPAAAASPRSSGGSAPALATSSGDSGGAGGKAPPRRKGGRPRIHHPRAPAAAAAAAAEGTTPPAQPYKKSGRGPKPKYIFGSAEEAADARRERNRKAALESYYKKKEHTQRLQAEIAGLQAENVALEGLLSAMTATGLCPLPEASNEGIDVWLKLNHPASAAVAGALP